MPDAKKNVGGVEVTEYFHRYVSCQLVLCSIPVILDMEPIRPGEGETVAAARLISRMLEQQPRMVDVFTFDALYADANVLNILNTAHKWWVVVLKQEAREAYDEIDRLLPLAIPFQHGADVTLWDIPQMTSWDALNAPFRAVVSEEKKQRVRLNPERKREKYIETSHWRWLTSLPEIYPATLVHRFGHARWNIENRGFNDLVTHCHFDHPFHHHPVALQSMLWIIAIAFNITCAFFARNFKPALRSRIATRQQLVMEMLKGFLTGKNLTAILRPPRGQT